MTWTQPWRIAAHDREAGWAFVQENSRVSLLRDAGILQVGAFLRMGASLASALLLAHLLGAQAQGRYYVAVALYSFTQLCLGTGVHAVTVSHTSKAFAEGDQDAVRRWLGFFIAIQGSVALILAAAGQLLPRAAHALAGIDPQVGRWAAVLSLTALIEMPRHIAAALLQARRRMSALAGLETSAELMRTFLVVAGALARGTPAGAVAGWLIGSLLSVPLALHALRREHCAGALPRVPDVWRSRRQLPLRQGLREGVALAMLRNAGALSIEVLPALVLARLGSPAWVAYLRITQRGVQAALALGAGVSRAVLPALGAAISDRLRFAALWKRATLLSAAAVGGAWILGVLILPPVLRVLAPPDYYAPVLAIARILTPGVVMLGTNGSSQAFYLATGTMPWAVRLALVITPLGVLTIIGGALADPRLGVAYGLCVVYLLQTAHVGYALLWIRRTSTGPWPGGRAQSS